MEGLLYIHIYEYIDNTTDKGVCKSIYFHYIDSYDGRKDFLVCRLSRKGDLLVLVTNTSGALLRADPSKTCGGLCLLALAPGGGPLLSGFLFQHGPVKCVVILVVQSPEEDAKQLAQIHVVWSLLKAQATAVV